MFGTGSRNPPCRLQAPPSSPAGCWLCGCWGSKLGERVGWLKAALPARPPSACVWVCHGENTRAPIWNTNQCTHIMPTVKLEPVEEMFNSDISAIFATFKCSLASTKKSMTDLSSHRVLLQICQICQICQIYVSQYLLIVHSHTQRRYDVSPFTK